MKLERAHEHARNARTRKQAAELYNSIEYELALGDHPAEVERTGEDALRGLEKRHPGIKDHAREVETPPSLSRTAGRRLREDGDRAHERVRDRRASHSRDQRRPRPASSPRRPRAARTVRRAARTVDQATGGWGQEIGHVLLLAMGMSIAYLLLTRAQAIGKLTQGATNVVRAVVSPVVDPLNPKGIR